MGVLRVENFGPLIAESGLEGNSLVEQENARRRQSGRIWTACRRNLKPNRSGDPRADDANGG